MTGRRLLAHCVIGLLGLALLLTGRSTAQPPAPQPSPPVTNTGPVPSVPPLADPIPSSVVPSAPPSDGGFQPAQTNIMPVTKGSPGTPRFRFQFQPNTPTKTLLPTPPAVKPIAGPVLTDDLSKIPEAEFAARPEKVTDPKMTEQTAHQLAKINHLNAKKTDAFMTALLESRDDLAGLPFAMGGACRTVGERTKQFTVAVATVRSALGGQQNVAITNVVGSMTRSPVSPNTLVLSEPQTQQLVVATQPSFWQQYTTLCEQEDAARNRTDKALAEHVTLARIAALSQMLAPQTAEIRLGLVKYLTGVPHVEATKALARLAIFSAEDDVRAAAITALKVRREKDYTDVLVQGLRYPWPAVAKRSADAIVKLERSDMVPELLAVLDAADPRLPATKEAGGKKVSVVREMVKINHHRNCIMCHAPGNPESGTGSAITAEVAVPGQPLPLPSEGYRQSSPDLMIRIDVTYLRQDFSAMMPVGDAHPWPEMQRFDFLVRERKLTDEEAISYRDQLTPKEAGVLSPYHKAALSALRELTGKDAAPTAEAWRKLLDLPAKATASNKPRE